MYVHIYVSVYRMLLMHNVVIYQILLPGIYILLVCKHLNTTAAPIKEALKRQLIVSFI